MPPILRIRPVKLGEGGGRGGGRERRGAWKKPIHRSLAIGDEWSSVTPRGGLSSSPPPMGVDTSCQMSLGQTFLYLNSSFRMTAVRRRETAGGPTSLSIDLTAA